MSKYTKRYSVRKRKRVPVRVYANRLRKRMTKAEVYLWKAIKSTTELLEYNILAQGVVIGRYVADFVSYRKKVVIEVDGGVHKLPHIAKKDKQRTADICSCGYVVLRFTNEEVFTDCSDVVSRILSVVSRR